MPTYKDAPFLDRAIASVCAQTLLDWELLIVDDGLTEAARNHLAETVASDSRIRIIKNGQNLGIQRSLNRALAEACGEYIARIDDDDQWTDANKLSRQIAFFKAHPDHVLVGTNAGIADASGAKLGTYTMPETDIAIRERVLMKNCFLHPTVMFRKSAVIKSGMYPEDADTKHIEDYALWLSLGQIGKMANLPEVSALLTVHTDSLTARNRLAQAERMRTLAARYKAAYPGFFRGYAVLSIRILFFRFLALVPIPKRVIYLFQKLYKSL